MKKTLLMILGLGIVCSPLLSQESAIRLHFTDQLKETEPTPDGSASWSTIGLNQFNIRSNRPGFSNGLSVLSHEDLIVFGDAPRYASLSDSGRSEGNDTERNHIKTQRLISGLGLAISYIGTVVVDLLDYDGYRRYTLIPVVGPWITLAKMAHNHDPGWPGAKPLLVLSGLAQTGFATYFIISLTRHPKPRATKSVTIGANFNSINLRIQF